MKNRKRLLTLALLCMAVAFFVLGLTACGNKGDNRDPQIVAVYNAYVANANEKGSTPLSYEEWLKSIKGEKGDKGDPGKSAYEIWLDNGFTGTEQDFLNWLKNQSNNADSLGLSFALTDEDTYSVSVGLATERSVIVIPAIYNNKPVTKIANKAFNECTNLKKVTIPDSVTSIGEYAFNYCTSLNMVYITDIAAWCNIKFNDYTSNPLSYAHNLYLNGELVTNLVIPDSVTSIGDRTFSGCTSLTSITIPDSVTSIGYGAFYNCPVEYTSASAFAFGYINKNNLKTAIITSGDSIGERAFSGCTSLTSITIGDSVTSISDSAFSGCTSLTSVTIPNSVISIGNGAFSGCTSFTNVTIHDSVTSISSRAFQNCTSLTSVTIPDSITSIGSHAFEDCNQLKTINYTGSEAQWESISKGYAWAPRTAYNINYNYVIPTNESTKEN